jgi:nucleotide-binding universal stress UspA family protein
MSKPKVMVALRDAEHVDDLMKLACQLAKSTEAELVAVHVVEVSPALPLDADDELLDRPGRAILSRAKLAASGMIPTTVVTRLVRARRPGEAIVEEATERGAELLILGYHRKPGLTEILLGSTVQYLAHHAPCRVIVEILPANPKQSS